MDETIARLRAELRPNWTSMRDCLDYIWTHPGATKTEILHKTGTCRSRGGGDPVQRLASRGMVYNLGRDNCHAWYVWQPIEQPAGFYAPGHP